MNISKEIVESTVQEMEALTSAELDELAAELRAEQPTYRAFLVSTQAIFSQDEKDRLYYLGIVLWQMMSRGPRRLGKVSKTRIQRSADKNVEWMRMLSNDTEADFYQAIQSMIETYPEPEVLSYVAEELMKESLDPQDPVFRDEVVGMAFVHLKIALDSLIYSLWK